MIVGVQVLALGLCAHAYGTYFMGERDPWFDRMRAASGSSTGCCSAAVITLVGFVLGAVIVGNWIDRGFGALSEERLAVLAATLDHRRHAGLLLVVPALDPGPAPPRLRCPTS